MINHTIKNKPSCRQHQLGLSKGLTIFAVISIAAIATMWFIVSQSFTSDPKRIGQGKPVAALIYNGGDSVSVNLKYGYKKLRDKYEDRVELMIVNIQSANGIRFKQHMDAKAGTILLYNGDGDEIALIQGPKSVEDLAKSIDDVFFPKALP